MGIRSMMAAAITALRGGGAARLRAPLAGNTRRRPGTAERRTLPHLDLGAGSAVMILQGYAMAPRTYLEVGRLLADRCRVVIPDLFTGPGRWSAERVRDDLLATVDHLGLDQVTLVGHSFGGALELAFATACPERVREAVFVDTLAMSREWTLAAEALHPLHLAWMATPRAAIDFFRSWATHPRQLAEAAWWGFTSDRREQVAALAESGIPCHVLWADRDSLLNRRDGQRFAEDMGARFTVVAGPDGNPVDHDWLYRHPELAVTELDRLGLAALSRD